MRTRSAWRLVTTLWSCWLVTLRRTTTCTSSLCTGSLGSWTSTPSMGECQQGRTAVSARRTLSCPRIRVIGWQKVSGWRRDTNAETQAKSSVEGQPLHTSAKSWGKPGWGRGSFAFFKQLSCRKRGLPQAPPLLSPLGVQFLSSQIYCRMIVP